MMKTKSSFLIIILLLLTLFSCGSSGFTERDVGIDTVEDNIKRGYIVFDDKSQTELNPRGVGLISGTYFDYNGNPEKTSISASIIGDAYDSSLLSSPEETQEDGSFSIYIVAGSVETQFELRVVAADGAKNSILIKVIPKDKGTIFLQLSYHGRRKVDSWEVWLLPPDSCDREDSEPLYSFTFENNGNLLSLSHIPEETVFACLVKGGVNFDEADSRYWWIKGCKQQVQINSPEIPAIIELTDEINFFHADLFEVNTTLHPGSIFQDEINEFLNPLLPVAGSPLETAGHLLDWIQNAFELEPDKQALFMVERAENAFDREIASIIENSEGRWLRGEVALLNENLISDTETITVNGKLVESIFWPSVPEEPVTAIHEIESMIVEGVDILSDVLNEELLRLTVNISYNEDMVFIGLHSFPAGGGTLLLRISEKILLPEIVGSETEECGFQQWLLSRIDCNAISNLIISNEIVAGLVDVDNAYEFYNSRCLDFISSIVREIDLAAQRIDTELQEIHFQGSASFLNEDGLPFQSKSASGSWYPFKWGNKNDPYPQIFTLYPFNYLP